MYVYKGHISIESYYRTSAIYLELRILVNFVAEWNNGGDHFQLLGILGRTENYIIWQTPNTVDWIESRFESNRNRERDAVVWPSRVPDLNTVLKVNSGISPEDNLRKFCVRFSLTQVHSCGTNSVTLSINMLILESAPQSKKHRKTLLNLSLFVVRIHHHRLIGFLA